MPKKKIYDIKPPKLSKKTESQIKEFMAEEKKSIEKIKDGKKHRPKKEGRSIWLPISISAVVVVLVVAVYLFFKLPKADILIWPKVDVLSYKQTITADESASLVDAEKAVIPAKYFEVSKTESQDFPATGNADDVGQASGTITVYNKYDPPTPLTLRAGTHFMSDSGKLFVASQKIVVPAAKKSGGKITPGSVQVTVKAVEGGESYNIAPSNFSVPGLKGTAFYYSIYATSTEAMAGGYAGKIKKVTDDDIKTAKETLVKTTTDSAIAQLRSEVPADYVLLDDAIVSNTTSASTKAKAGTVGEKFNYQATVKASCLAFKKSDVDKFAKDYIISQMPDGKTMLDSSYKIVYTATAIDISGGKTTLNVDFSSGIYQSIDKNSLSLSLTGKNANQIKETINKNLVEGASKVEVDFWPFWVAKAPNSQKAVNVWLKFE